MQVLFLVPINYLASDIEALCFVMRMVLASGGLLFIPKAGFVYT
jgi:hypothetical protein